MRRYQPCRRGVAAMLAMLYLILFAVLAAGFYAGTNTASRVVHNDQQTAIASLAAESGMDFARYQLAQLTIPHGTPQANLFSTVYTQLTSNIASTANMAGKSISLSGAVISIPGGVDNYIQVTRGGPRFRITIENLGQKIRVKSVGRTPDGKNARAVQIDYALAQRASSIFDYGVASRGKIYTDGSSRIRGATDPTKGSVLSTTTTDPVPIEIRGKEVSGDLSATNPNGLIVFPGATIAGLTDPLKINAEHVHKGVPEPEFPTIDTSAFAAYVTSTYTGGSTLENCRIPANTNPSFSGGCTLRGVIYVETPNRLTFRGNVNIQGAIVTQTANVTGSLSENVLDFSGSVSAQGIQTLPDSFGNLRKLTGSFILAPESHVRFSGNFGLVRGHIIAGKATFDGSAGGIIHGSIITLKDTQTTIKGSSDVIIASTGTMDYPAGVFFSSNYVPLPDTYEEVKP